MSPPSRSEDNFSVCQLAFSLGRLIPARPKDYGVLEVGKATTLITKGDVLSKRQLSPIPSIFVAGKGLSGIGRPETSSALNISEYVHCSCF